MGVKNSSGENAEGMASLAVEVGGMCLARTTAVLQLEEQVRRGEACDPTKDQWCEECLTGPSLCAVQILKLLLESWDIAQDPVELDRVLTG